MWAHTKDFVPGVSVVGTWEIGTSSTVVRVFGTVTSLAGVGDLGVGASLADVWRIGAATSLAGSWSEVIRMFTTESKRPTTAPRGLANQRIDFQFNIDRNTKDGSLQPATTPEGKLEIWFDGVHRFLHITVYNSKGPHTLTI